VRKPGQFKKEQNRHRYNQSIWDACKRAKNGEEDVWVTLYNEYGKLYRVKLMTGSWDVYTDYTHENGCTHVLVNGRDKTPILTELAGKDSKVWYTDLKSSDVILNKKAASSVFWSKICLARVAEMHVREVTE